MAYSAKIKKVQLEVVIRTTQEKVEGMIYMLPGIRLLDMLNKTEETFLAVSSAMVYSLQTERLIFEAEFMVLNKAHIVLIAESYRIP